MPAGMPCKRGERASATHCIPRGYIGSSGRGQPKQSGTSTPPSKNTYPKKPSGARGRGELRSESRGRAGFNARRPGTPSYTNVGFRAYGGVAKAEEFFIPLDQGTIFLPGSKFVMLPDRDEALGTIKDTEKGGTVLLVVKTSTAQEQDGKLVPKPGSRYKITNAGENTQWGKSWLRIVQVAEEPNTPSREGHKQLPGSETKAFAAGDAPTKIQPKPKPQGQSAPAPKPSPKPAGKPAPTTQVVSPKQRANAPVKRSGHAALRAKYKPPQAKPMPEYGGEEAIEERELSREATAKKKQEAAQLQVRQGAGVDSGAPTKVGYKPVQPKLRVNPSSFERETPRPTNDSPTGDVAPDDEAVEGLGGPGRAVPPPGNKIDTTGATTPGEMDEEAIVERVGKTPGSPPEQANVEEAQWDSPPEQAGMEEAQWDSPPDAGGSSPQLAEATATLNRYSTPEQQEQAKQVFTQFVRSGDYEKNDASQVELTPRQAEENIAWLDEVTDWASRGEEIQPGDPKGPLVATRLLSVLKNPQVATPERIEAIAEKVSSGKRIAGDVISGIAAFLEGMFEVDLLEPVSKIVAGTLGSSSLDYAKQMAEVMSRHLDANAKQENKDKQVEAIEAEAIGELNDRVRSREIGPADKQKLIRAFTQALKEGEKLGITDPEELKAYAKEHAGYVEDSMKEVEGDAIPEGIPVPQAEQVGQAPAVSPKTAIQAAQPAADQVPPGAPAQAAPAAPVGKQGARTVLTPPAGQTQVLKKKPRLPLPQGETRRLVLEGAKRSIQDSPHLDPTQKPDFEKLFERTAGVLPDKAMDILNDGGGFHFYSDPKKIKEELVKLYPKFTKYAKAGNMIGGAYVPKDNSVHSDGGLPRKPGLKRADQVLAHEMGHKILRGVDTSKEWVDAWNAEINLDGDPLSKYARKQPKEGAAEFYRYLTQAALNGTLEEAQAQFPQAYAVVEKAGLLPGAQGEGDATEAAQGPAEGMELASEIENPTEEDLKEEIARAQREQQLASEEGNDVDYESWTQELEELYGQLDQLTQGEGGEEVAGNPEEEELQAQLREAEASRDAAMEAGNDEEAEQWNEQIESIYGQLDATRGEEIELAEEEGFPRDEKGKPLWNTAQRMVTPDEWKEVTAVFADATRRGKDPEEARSIAEGTFAEIIGNKKVAKPKASEEPSLTNQAPTQQKPTEQSFKPSRKTQVRGQAEPEQTHQLGEPSEMDEEGIYPTHKLEPVATQRKLDPSRQERPKDKPKETPDARIARETAELKEKYAAKPEPKPKDAQEEKVERFKFDDAWVFPQPEDLEPEQQETLPEDVVHLERFLRHTPSGHPYWVVKVWKEGVDKPLKWVKGEQAWVEEGLFKRKFKEGPPADIAEAYQRYYDPLKKSAERSLRSGPDAEDVVNNMFLYFQKHGMNPKEGVPFGKWIFAALKGHISNLRQKQTAQKRDVRKTEGFQTDEEGEIINEPRQRRETTPINKLIRREEKQRLRDFVANLPDNQRRAFEMRHLQDPPASYAEIAEQMGSDVSKVTNYLHDAMQNVRRELGEDEMGDEIQGERGVHGKRQRDIKALYEQFETQSQQVDFLTKSMADLLTMLGA